MANKQLVGHMYDSLDLLLRKGSELPESRKRAIVHYLRKSVLEFPWEIISLVREEKNVSLDISRASTSEVYSLSILFSHLLNTPLVHKEGLWARIGDHLSSALFSVSESSQEVQ